MKMWMGLLCAIMSFSIGCAGSKKDADHGGDVPGKLGNIDSGSRCELEEGQVEDLIDLNHDGQADVRKILIVLDNGSRILVCREADLDFDGAKDVFVFYDGEGRILRDEMNLDFKDTVDIVSLYAKGKIIKQEIDTNSDGRVDRVRYLEDGVPVRVEGDTDNNGIVDYWEYYEAGKLIRIGLDENGDGKADNWSRDGETQTQLNEEEEKAEEKKEE